MMWMKKLKLFMLLLLLLVATSISSCLEKSQTRVVEIKNFSYQPSSITITPGTVVTWINEDPAEHTVTATNGDFNSGNLATGEEFNQTFSRPGTYQYQCQNHPSMVGEVVVVAEQSGNASSNAADQGASIAGLKLLAEGFAAPMEFVSSHDGTGRMFVVDQTGLGKIITSDGKLIEEPFLDIRDRMVDISPNYDERGLLGLAFHPDFARNGRLFVFYSAPLRSAAPEGWSCTNHLSEFTVSKEDQNKVNLSSERVLLQVDKPQMNHNGGTIAFGPDGYLYLPLGDGGGANDVDHAPEGNGQKTSTLLGKILRIDVNNASAAYGIPADNPFVGVAGYRPEIWAFGFRNPWRISFDDEGRLFVSDAGQNLWEEVDIVTKGGNYGWHIREGTHCFNPNNPNEPLASCPDRGRRGEPLMDPIIEYGHDGRTVVVGGYIYRGKALPELDGSYIFADWSSGFARGDGTLLMASPSQKGLWEVKEIRVANGRVKQDYSLCRVAFDSLAACYKAACKFIVDTKNGYHGKKIKG
ncbi:MAG: PQQ-dependent sugar dehydrogenase [Methanothrix sp.]|nr:PQQ-dependent sugar dehydrogenase [Methanothrix sp.]